MRKCIFSIYDNTLKDLPVSQRYVERKGFFHQWGTETVDSGDKVAEGTVAVVEAEDGEVFLINPARIKFTEPLTAPDLKGVHEMD